MKKILFAISFLITFSINAQNYNVPFYPGGIYDESVITPQEVLGFSIGDRPVNYGEMVHYISKLSGQSSLVELHQDGETHQGRKLYYVVISSEQNLSKLREIKSGLSKLADPRKTNESEAKDIIENSPAVAFIMCSIHGNESSGTDAGIQLAYQLAAGTDDATKNLLDNLIVIIYPMENPDGRERFLHQLETWRGKVRNSDTQSMPHSGVWPSGRTNHYHFDLNRDWFILSQPESRARAKIVRDWFPQLVVDAHEMGSFSSFLFNPPREPINPNMDIKIRNWWKTFAEEQGEAFDKYGWSYYTREWLEEWYPGYGSSYPSYRGAVAILYEQARTSGIEVKRPDGIILTFAEAVHHQFVSSIANLKTVAKNKKQLLADFYSVHLDAVNKSRKDGIKTFIIHPGKNKSRADKLAEILMFHGIEVYEAQIEFNVSDAVNYWSEKPSGKFPKGSYIIPVMQPAQPLINAILEFDTRMNNKFVKSERKSLEKGEGTRLYEVSAWSMPMAFGVETYVTSSKIKVQSRPAGQAGVKVEEIEKVKGKVENGKPLYGYLIKYEDDNSVKALLKLFDNKIKVRSARKKFKVEDNSYDRGTLLIRKVENPDLDENLLKIIAEETGVEITGVNTALSQSGSDLGADQFPLLESPRTAMLVGSSFSVYNYGTMMHLLDNDLRMRVTTLNADYFSRYDLRKYNVMIMPSFWGGAQGLKNTLGQRGLKKLKDWISSGGTLIAVGNSAAALADSSLGISKVKLRAQVLSDLDSYKEAVEKEEKVKNISVDSLSVWENKITAKQEESKDKKEKVNAKKMKEIDSFSRRFMPQGAIVGIDLNEEHWLNYGTAAKLPALYSSSHVLMSKPPVQTAARISGKEKMRLSGLLWSEAKDRMEHGAYLTRESMGSGQIILFAEEPNFRSYFEGTEKLLLNSILLGPGFGARQTVEW